MAMSPFEIENMSVDITSPSSASTPRMDGSSPMASSIKNLCSKLLTSCQRSEQLSAALTPENKATVNRIASPFVKGRGPFNPFNQNLKERLENPVFSPNVFSTVISPSQDSNEFKWTIDDLSKINPVPIEEEFHFEEQVDEQIETEMQKTIDKYFTKTHMVFSPWDCKLPTSWTSFTEVFKKEKQKILSNEHVNPTVSSSPYPYSMSRLQFISGTPCQNVSTQTCLSLPPDLPENINSLLKPYYSETSFEEMNYSMNNSLRRKLFIQKEEENLSSANLFHLQNDSPLMSSCYPSTPVVKLRTDGSPLENFSPLDISPIDRIGNKLLCNGCGSASQIKIDTEDLREIKYLKSSKENIDPSNRNQVGLHYEECFKVFESPKISCGNRRTRKRRRSLSQDMDMSPLYTNFAAKHNSLEQIGPRFRAYSSDEMKMSVDTCSENLGEFQDTGYDSGMTCTTNFDKFATKNDSDSKLATFNSWMDKLKDNSKVLIASTPTKK